MMIKDQQLADMTISLGSIDPCFSCTDRLETIDVRSGCTRVYTHSELLALVNDKVWIGHFTIWQEEKALVYRHVLPLRGSDGPTVEQSEDLVNHAIMECDRFYPAVHYVLWGGKTPSEAVDAAMFETQGEA